MEFNIGLIRVLTTENEVILNAHGRLLESYFPNFKVESKCIKDQHEGIHCEKTKAIAIPKIIELAKEYEDKDAIIISCAGDPALEELRNIYTEKPVIGAGESVAILSSQRRKKVGVMGITNNVPKAYSDNLGELIINLGVPKGVSSTLDLMTEEGRSACFNKAFELKENGAEIIALACTGMSTIKIAKDMERKIGIPVLDPVICEGIITYFELLRRG